MATALSDINFQSEIFGTTLQMEFTHRVGLMSSGLMVQASDQLIRPGQQGQLASVMKWKALTPGANQINSSLTTSFKKIEDWKDTAVWVEREDAWDAETIIQLIAGKDPTQAVISALATYWAREIHTSAVNVLKGIFASALATSHSTGSTYIADTITSKGVLQGKQLLGDNKDMLRVIVMNSKVHTDAVDANLQVDTPRADVAYQTGVIQRILGMAPTETDLIEAVSSVYSSYLATIGAMVWKTRPRPQAQFNNANVIRAGDIEIELYRNSVSAGGIDGLITRLSYLAHCPGVTYDFSTGPTNPTDAQLATGSNWSKVSNDDKLIRLAELKTL